MAMWTGRTMRLAFTLIEMLIVVAVITVLIGLLMPAIQAARESARLGQCRNNVRQMAMACIQHEQAAATFPYGTSMYDWTGDADLGNGDKRVFNPDYPNMVGKPPVDQGSLQTGGWQFNILPYLDLADLHQWGAGTTGATKFQWNSKRAGVVVPTYVCASRPDPRIYGSNLFKNASNTGWPGFTVRPDFSGSVGTGTGMMMGRRSYEVTDGLSNVFLLGHKYINPLEYSSRIGCQDQGWTVGQDWDNIAYTQATGPEWGDPGLSANGLRPARNYNPMRDTVSRPTCGEFPAGAPFTWGYPTGSRFGSPHAVLPMAMADGSVTSLDYSINLTIFQQLGNVADGGVLPQGL